MKFDLHINQRAILENGFDIDLVDGAILDFCRSFSASGSCRFLVEQGVRYYWFSHKNICKQLPILRMKPDSIYRRMKGLCDKNFLKAHPENRQRNESWYAFGPLADALVGTIGFKSEPSEIHPKGSDQTPGPKSEPSDLNPDPSDENPNPIGSPSEGPSDFDPIYKNISDEGDNKILPTTTDVADATLRQGSKKITLSKPAPETPPPPNPPPPSSESVGDGRLRNDCLAYHNANPKKYLPDMYRAFLRYWTAPVKNGPKKDIGKELWETQKTWDLPGRLANWYQRNQTDHATERNPTNGNRSAHYLARQRAAEPASDYGDL